MDKNTPYIPIDCSIHDIYEIAIMRGQVLKLTWDNGDQASIKTTVYPQDVITENKAEYLIAKTGSGENLKMRLDWIKSVKIDSE